jgi:hypothetical protein
VTHHVRHQFRDHEGDGLGSLTRHLAWQAAQNARAIRRACTAACGCLSSLAPGTGPKSQDGSTVVIPLSPLPCFPPVRRAAAPHRVRRCGGQAASPSSRTAGSHVTGSPPSHRGHRSRRRARAERRRPAFPARPWRREPASRRPASRRAESQGRIHGGSGGVPRRIGGTRARVANAHGCLGDIAPVTAERPGDPEAATAERRGGGPFGQVPAEATAPSLHPASSSMPGVTRRNTARQQETAECPGPVRHESRRTHR